MNAKTTAIGVAAALAGLSLSVSVHAASWDTCDGKPLVWKNGWTNMYISTLSMPIDSIWDLQTQYMMSEWRDVNGSNFTYYYGRDSDGSTDTSNGRNEIDFKNKPNETYLGVTSVRYECSWYWLFGKQWTRHLTETDIHLNLRYNWTTGDFTGSTIGSPYNFELIMLHELGQALGLEHSDGRMAVMNTLYFNSGPSGHYHEVEPHGDDAYGVRILYPDSTTERDISVSRFRNAGGTTSDVNRVATTSGVTVTTLTRGGQYDVRYTMENLGTQSESVAVCFYLSTNSHISTTDTYLASSDWTMPTSSFVTADRRITIPAGVAPGTYYIGYVADPTNGIPEGDESNNYVSLLTTVTAS